MKTIISRYSLSVFLFSYNEFYFQKYKNKFSTVWINDLKKIETIESFLEIHHQLIDIRQQYNELKLTAKEIDDEPLSIGIGCLEIKLGKHFKLENILS